MYLFWIKIVDRVGNRESIQSLPSSKFHLQEKQVAWLGLFPQARNQLGIVVRQSTNGTYICHNIDPRHDGHMLVP